MIDKEKLKELIEERKSLAKEFGAFTTKAKDFDKKFCELLGKPEGSVVTQEDVIEALL